MSPFDPALAETSDYLHTATGLEKYVAGAAGCWFAKVRGRDPEDGAAVGVAWYHGDYHLKSEASRRAGQLLSHVRSLRLAAL